MIRSLFFLWRLTFAFAAVIGLALVGTIKAIGFMARCYVKLMDVQIQPSQKTRYVAAVPKIKPVPSVPRGAVVVVSSSRVTVV